MVFLFRDTLSLIEMCHTRTWIFFVEEKDFVEVHGNRFWKPFVEKPVNGELLDSHEVHDISLFAAIL